MLINMCDSSLQPKIICDKPCYDGYEVEKLIDGASHLNVGFMVERFIKSPVSVTLQFPCNVELSKICIDPTVGEQKSLGFEVYTKSDTVKNSWLMDSESQDDTAIDMNGIFVPIGRTLLKEAKKFCFRNYSFSSKQVQVASSICCQQDVPLKHHMRKSLAFVSHVTLRITQTVGSCVPCIGQLEIWAKPVIHNDKNLRSKIYSCFQRSLRNSEEHEIDAQTEGSCHGDTNEAAPLPADNKTSLIMNGVDIPEDFIDPLTCEVMLIPMLLPSGQSIDQSTLENHTRTESTWGRAPNNPFTGIKFTRTYKPIPNESLKVRIDKFLMDHSMQLPNQSRTLGRAADLQNQGLSVQSTEWVQSARARIESQKPLVDQTCSESQTLSSVNTAQSIPPHRNQEGMSSTPKDQPTTRTEKSKTKSATGRSSAKSTETKNKSFEMKHLGLKRKSLSTPETDENFQNLNTDSKKLRASSGLLGDACSHEDNLRQSLDAALSVTLGKLPSFQTSAESKRKSDDKKCFVCTKSDTAALYVLPCGHIVCRLCLDDQSANLSDAVKYLCPQCQNTFHSKEVERLYI